jgi:hypothetical protein
MTRPTNQDGACHSEQRAIPGEPGARRNRKVNSMLNGMTRSRAIEIWFAAVTLAVVAGLALGVSIKISTAAFLLPLSLVPPAIALKLWRSPQPRTTVEMLYPPIERESDV